MIREIDNFQDVPKRGIEPPFPCGNTLLKRARLPVSPLRQDRILGTLLYFKLSFTGEVKIAL